MAIILDKLKFQQDGFTLCADLRINPNQTTAIIGPSGGGKSTLLMLIAGFVAPLSGRILIDGNDITKHLPQKRPVAMLFQENNLFPHLDVFQNTALGVNPGLKLDEREKQQVLEALAKVGLKGRDNEFPQNLSGGQRQRVALARVLLQAQPVLLLDEPFAALGPGLRHEMLDLVADIRAGQNITLLLVTHNPQDAQKIAPETIFVQGGQVGKPVNTSELFQYPPKALAQYLG